MKRVQLIISGIVQGVGFRYWICQKAKQLGVTGWVRNREDGAVEIVGVGRESALNELIAYAKVGPPAAQVDRIDEEWDTGGQYREFKIKT